MKKTKVYLNPEQIEQAKSLRAQGVDCQTIAAIFNVSQSTVSKHTGTPRRTYTDGPQAVGVYPEAEPSAWSPETPIEGQVTVAEAINDANLASLVVQAEAIIERLDAIIKALEVRE